MTTEIPIPGVPQHDIDDDTPLMYEYQAELGGMSLPITRHFPSAAAPVHPTSAFTSRDDISTSWPPRPSVRLVSRSARRYASSHKQKDNGVAQSGRKGKSFEPWDFSEVASATDQVQSAFQRGSARAERPPREGVSGTYFIRRVESKNSVLGVFKPVDEEAGDLERSPSIVPSSLGRSPQGDSFSLGPHHGMCVSPSDGSPSPSPLSFPDFHYQSDRLQGDTPGFAAGEGALKEVAAYLLDHDHFARVPQTALATCMFESDLPEKNKPGDSSSSSSHSSSSTSFAVDPLYFRTEQGDEQGNLRTKTGAFQVYVSNVGDADDFGPGVFDKDQVHQIAILDIRTLNHDRHSGNILVRPSTRKSTKGSRYDIIPIDHGYCLPAVVKSVPWPIWMDWSMIREELSPEVKAYVARLDANSEARILNDELEGRIRVSSLRTLKIATALLQKGVAAGLTLYEIGLLIYSPRQCPEMRTELQKIVEEAEEAGYARKSHIAQETYSHGKAIGQNQPGLLPYKSSGYLPPTWGARPDSETYIDEYIVKYAVKRISDLVRRVADNKKTIPKANGCGISPFRSLGRVRSIPDFGIGMRPMNAVLNSPANDCEAPTPLPSPVGRSRPSPIERLGEEMNAPFRFSIDSSALSIPMPLKTPVPMNSFLPKPDLSTSKSHARKRPPYRPRHRRNASERIPIEKVGSLECDDDKPSIPKPARLPLDKIGVRDGTVSMSRQLPPFFKAPRKSSPVAALDAVSLWANGGSEGDTLA